jgi:hypothetical protein
MPTVQQRYYEVLRERVSNDRYPSGQMLDRLEAAITTGDQLVDYVEMLIEKVDESWYPSGQMLDRIQHMLQTTARLA